MDRLRRPLITLSDVERYQGPAWRVSRDGTRHSCHSPHSAERHSLPERLSVCACGTPGGPPGVRVPSPPPPTPGVPADSSLAPSPQQEDISRSDGSRRRTEAVGSAAREWSWSRLGLTPARSLCVSEQARAPLASQYCGGERSRPSVEG